MTSVLTLYSISLTMLSSYTTHIYSKMWYLFRYLFQ